MNKKLAATATSLSEWFDQNNRSLPWRENIPDPYKVWISEIMLQQTTSSAVAPFFEKFIKNWPTVEELSQASIEEVYEFWQGLGYYSRARNLLKASKYIMHDLNGVFPNKAEKLKKLPGVGPYTSAAIASICFGEAVGVVDGNVLRVYNRLIGEKRDWWKSDFYKETELFSTSLCTLGDSPSVINQSLMDLGATICTPKSPTCLLCPIKKNCQSFKKGLQKKLPIPRPKKSSEDWIYKVFKTTDDSRKSLCGVLDRQPVLKGKPLPLGIFEKANTKPKNFAFKHTITHHNIYIEFESKKPDLDLVQRSENLTLEELSRITPSSLVKKIWQSPQFYESIV